MKSLKIHVTVSRHCQSVQSRGWESVLIILSMRCILWQESLIRSKQEWLHLCMYIVRVYFLLRPDWAFLDECTSAVSMDVEGSIYQVRGNKRENSMKVSSLAMTITAVLITLTWALNSYTNLCTEFILSAPKFTAYLYCICFSIELRYTKADAVQICGTF